MNYYTKEGFAKLKNEYDRVKNKMATTSPEEIKNKRPMYYIHDYFKELDYQLHHAIIIEDTDEYQNWDGQSVIRKCEVELSIEDEESEIYRILGYNEGNILFRTLSCDSPFVLSLLGHKIGETLYFGDMKVTIKNVSKLVNNEKKLKKTK